ncbi:hypothetical protein GOQ27_15145 [Clostridium sp. D2Q-11]|uniref:Uncharacterized protein n=1 Tax=Anaeromonas frigoriresistens TaxID=2683708 RepID=A0A942UZT6_9FIRM|nr:hypothetical protein [Anaeromonas frigoriresistens]MBS4539809.1 hypothetical protein [Anaeromonas frigoriresistens]
MLLEGRKLQEVVYNELFNELQSSLEEKEIEYNNMVKSREKEILLDKFYYMMNLKYEQNKSNIDYANEHENRVKNEIITLKRKIDVLEKCKSTFIDE